MIQMAPIPTFEKMEEYANMLLVRYVQPHFRAGVATVHIIFDLPGGLPESPKQLEQSRRDSAKSAKLATHQCTTFNSSACIPQ